MVQFSAEVIYIGATLDQHGDLGVSIFCGRKIRHTVEAVVKFIAKITAMLHQNPETLVHLALEFRIFHLKDYFPNFLFIGRSEAMTLLHLGLILLLGIEI
jgi:hypothetical protein